MIIAAVQVQEHPNGDKQRLKSQLESIHQQLEKICEIDKKIYGFITKNLAKSKKAQLQIRFDNCLNVELNPKFEPFIDGLVKHNLRQALGLLEKALILYDQAIAGKKVEASKITTKLQRSVILLKYIIDKL